MRHGLIVKAVYKYVVAVDLIAALYQGAQICGLEKTDGGIHLGADAKIAIQILAFCIDHRDRPFGRGSENGTAGYYKIWCVIYDNMSKV